MATVGLKGIWGLEQLDRTDIATWKAGIILVGGSVIAAGLINQLMMAVGEFDTLFQVRNPYLFTFFFGLLPGFILLFSFWLSRTVESDMQLLSEVDASLLQVASHFKIKKRILILAVVVGIISINIMVYVPTIWINNTTFSQIMRWSTATIENATIMYVLYPAVGVFIGILLAVILTQSLTLTRAANQVKIDLLDLSKYPAIANPAIRYVLILLVTISCFMTLPTIDNEMTMTSVAPIILIIIATALPTLLLYGYPVYVLRNRIKEEKQKELKIVFLALKGDDVQLESARIQRKGVPLSIGDLLTHQMFVESRWEWPIATHIQRLILFGLLPLVTWVLATTIESALY